MVPNRIRDMRVQAGLSQEDVADSLPNEVTRVIVSFLEGGKVLPTVESMKGLCDLFICSPTDLYDPGELDLALAETYPDVVARPPAKKGGGRGAGHEGMTEFRVWVKPEEKAALESAVAKLGYRNTTEWFREVFRGALERCTMMGLSESGSNIVILHSRNQTI
jgi:DNA-binding XRE family transcriptional regulator